MAVRFDVDGDELTRTTGLPSVTPLTVALWFKISTDLNTFGQTCFALYADTSNFLYLQTSNDGTTMRLWPNIAGDTAGEITLVNMTVGTWYFLAVTINGTAENAYWAAESDASLSTANGTTLSASWFTPSTLKIGDSPWTGEYVNGVVEDLKIWQAALTQAELELERRTRRPQRFANLYQWHPMHPGSGERARDYSGNGRDLTEAGTLTDEDGPPVGWGALPIVFPFVATGDQTISPSSIASAEAFGTAAVSISGVAQGLYAVGTNVVATDTNWVDVATIADTSFTAGDTYLILAHAFARMASSTDQCQLRLVHGTTPTAFTDASLSAELTSGTQEHDFGWMTTYTQPGTAELVKIQASSSSTTDVTVELGQVFALNLDDVGVSGTDYHYNEVTADYTTTATKTAQAAVTFTPNGTDDWLIIGAFEQQPGSATANYLADLNDSVAGVLTSLDIEGEDTTNDRRGHLLMRVVTPTNASHTFSIRFSHESTAGTVHSSRILALNLNKFAQHAFVFDAAEDAPAASPSWTTTRTLAPTPDVTGDWFIWGHYISDINGTTDDLATRLQINASGGGLASNPNYTNSSPGVDNWDATDEIPVNIFTLVQLASGASRTINLDVQMIAGTAARVEDRNLVAFSLRLAAPPGDQTVSPGAIDSAEAFGSDRLDLTLTGTGIATGEAFGTDQLDLTLLPSGKASDEAFGTATMQPGPVTVSPNAIASGETFGVAQLNLVLLPSAIGPAETFGATTVTPGPVTISPSGVGSGEAFGATQVDLTLLALSIASAEAFGSAQLNLTLVLTAIASGEAFGASQLNLTLLLSATQSAETFGSAVVSAEGGNQTVSPSGVASLETFGTALLTPGAVTISPNAIGSGEAFGDTIVLAGGTIILPISIGSAEAFGTLTMQPGVVTLLPSAIASLEAFGAALIVPGAVTIAPAGIGSAETFGIARLDLTLLLAAISSAETFGTLVLIPGAVSIGPDGIVSLETFGAAVVSGGQNPFVPIPLTATSRHGRSLMADARLRALSADGHGRSLTSED